MTCLLVWTIHHVDFAVFRCAGIPAVGERAREEGERGRFLFLAIAYPSDIDLANRGDFLLWVGTRGMPLAAMWIPPRS